MDRHKLQQTIESIEELLRHGSPSCVRQANGLMIENFRAIAYFALNLSKPKPKPKHTIADSYPAGGIPEPCTFCKNYEQLEEDNVQLKSDLIIKDEQIKKLKGSCICMDCGKIIKTVEQNKHVKECKKQVIAKERW